MRTSWGPCCPASGFHPRLCTMLTMTTGLCRTPRHLLRWPWAWPSLGFPWTRRRAASEFSGHWFYLPPLQPAFFSRTCWQPWRSFIAFSLRSLGLSLLSGGSTPGRRVLHPCGSSRRVAFTWSTSSSSCSCMGLEETTSTILRHNSWVLSSIQPNEPLLGFREPLRESSRRAYRNGSACHSGRSTSSTFRVLLREAAPGGR